MRVAGRLAIGAIEDPHGGEALVLLVAALLAGAAAGVRGRDSEAAPELLDPRHAFCVAGQAIDVPQLAERGQHILVMLAVGGAFDAEYALQQRFGLRDSAWP